MLKKIVNIIGIFLIIVSTFFLVKKLITKLIYNINKEEKINIFFKEYNNDGNKILKDDYLMILEIPTIKLNEGIYDFDNDKNNIEKNVSILKYSSLPDNDNSILLLAAHSGNADNAYFKNLYKLKYNDLINVYYNKNLYKYKVNNIYVISKNDDFFVKDFNKKTLILITCFDNYKYLIIESQIV